MRFQKGAVMCKITEVSQFMVIHSQWRNNFRVSWPVHEGHGNSFPYQHSKSQNRSRFYQQVWVSSKFCYLKSHHQLWPSGSYYLRMRFFFAISEVLNHIGSKEKSLFLFPHEQVSQPIKNAWGNSQKWTGIGQCYDKPLKREPVKICKGRQQEEMQIGDSLPPTGGRERVWQTSVIDFTPLKAKNKMLPPSPQDGNC